MSRAVFEDRQLYGVYINSVMVAVITALVGTLISYGGALVTSEKHGQRKTQESDRQHRSCDQHDSGYGNRSCLSVRVHRNAAAEYVPDYHYM